MAHDPSYHRSGDAIGRRELLKRSALGGGTAAAMGLLALKAAPAYADGPTARTAVDHDPTATASAVANPAKGVVLFDDPTFNFEALFALGGVAYGAGEVGEIIATVNQINAEGLSYQSFVDNFLATAARVGRIADNALKAGHRVTARSAYLRSAAYYDQALFFILGTRTPAREPVIYRKMQRQWNRATQLFDPPFERIKIPYQGTYMPGYFFKPNRSSIKRPTVIINNGSDAENVDVWAFGAAAAIARGYNALIFEGPGQGSMLFLREIPFRPDWEKVITPIVDYLHSRRDVDKKRIVMTGWSFTGELVIRAAAFEKRIAAVVADPGSVDTWLAYPAFLRNLFAHGATREQVNHSWNQDLVPGLSAPDRFLFAKRSEVFGKQFLRTARAGKVLTDFWTFGKRASRFSNLDVIHKVRAPVLEVARIVVELRRRSSRG